MEHKIDNPASGDEIFRIMELVVFRASSLSWKALATELG